MTQPLHFNCITYFLKPFASFTLQTNHESKMSEETCRNIDAVIDYVIEQGQVNADGLFSGRESGKENRKRNHSHSNSPVSTNLQVNDSDDSVTFNEAKQEPLAIKKPRRSILDMLSVTHNPNPVAPAITVKKVSVCLTKLSDEVMEVVDNCTVAVAQENACEQASSNKTATAEDETSSKNSSSAAHQMHDTIDLCADEQSSTPTHITPCKDELKTASAQTTRLKKSPLSSSVSSDLHRSACFF